MAVQLIHKNSSVEDKHALPQQLTNGEISLNYNQAGAFLSCKDSAGNIQHLGGVKINDAAPGSPSKQALWFQPSTGKLFVYDGTGWQVVAAGGSGPGSSTVDQVLGGNGINCSPSTGLGIITLDADVDTYKGLKFLSGKIAIALGSGLEFDVTTGQVKATASATTYKGTVNLTTSTAKPTGVSAGDTFYNNGTGTSNAVWNPSPATGTAVTAGDLVAYNGTDWDYIPSGAANANPAIWSKTGGVVALSTSSDDVEIGGGNIALNSNGTADFVNLNVSSSGAATFGSASFASDVTIGAYNASSATVSGAKVFTNGLVAAQRASGDNSDVWRGYQGTTITSKISGDGTAVFNGNISAVEGTFTDDVNAVNGQFSNDVNVTGAVTAASFSGSGAALTGVIANLVNEATPQLGGPLDLNSNNITGTGNVNITGTVTATSFTGGLATTNLTGTITNAQLAGSISDDKLASTFLKNVSEDTTPQLGGSLDVNGNSIVSVSNGNITLAPNGTGEVDIDSTTAIIVPVGTEAQRPATPEAGMIRFNSDTDKYESYDGTNWGSLVGGDIGTAPENIPINQYLGKQAFVDEVGTLRPYFPTGSFYSAPQTGGDIQFRYVSDTEVQLVMKGLDGTIRSSVVALETSVNTWTPTAFTIGSQSPTITSATITRLGTTAILTINFGGSQTYADGDIVSITGLPVNGDGTGVLAGRNSGAGGATVQGNLVTAGTNAYGKVSYASGSINLGRVTFTVTGV